MEALRVHELSCNSCHPQPYLYLHHAGEAFTLLGESPTFDSCLGHSGSAVGVCALTIVKLHQLPSSQTDVRIRHLSPGEWEESRRFIVFFSSGFGY